ncbi:hypothetical protein Tco_1354719 [Tanacetum coccineum]
MTELPIYCHDWGLPFELMCDASDFAIGVMPLIVSLDLVMSKRIVYTEHSASSISLPRRMRRQDSMRWIYCSRIWTLMFETKKESENREIIFQDWKIPNQDNFENKEINEAFPLETLGSIALKDDSTPWFAIFANYPMRGNSFIKW